MEVVQRHEKLQREHENLRQYSTQIKAQLEQLRHEIDELLVRHRSLIVQHLPLTVSKQATRTVYCIPIPFVHSRVFVRVKKRSIERKKRRLSRLLAYSHTAIILPFTTY